MVKNSLNFGDVHYTERKYIVFKHSKKLLKSIYWYIVWKYLDKRVMKEWRRK